MHFSVKYFVKMAKIGHLFSLKLNVEEHRIFFSVRGFQNRFQSKCVFLLVLAATDSICEIAKLIFCCSEYFSIFAPEFKGLQAIFVCPRHFRPSHFTVLL